MKILFINGVNLNMTGVREKGVYGVQSLDEINAEIAAYFKGDECLFFQSYCEGDICSRIQSSKEEGIDGIVLNAGAYTHYSHAIGDALGCVKVPKAEVHISNVHAREDFRHVSVLADNCNGVICGFGADSYKLACLAVKSVMERAAK